MSALEGPQPPPGPPPGLVTLGPPVVPLEQDAAKYLDLVEGYLPALGTHIFSGAQNVGKTAFTTWLLSEVGNRGEFLGHKAHLPSWVRLFVFDRSRADWEYWSGVAGIACPEGYWVLDDKDLTIATIRGWKGYQKVIDYWEAKVISMSPEPGGLIITDGGLDLVGDGTTKYFDAYANMVAVQRITRRLKLTHLLICHAGKPKPLGSKDAKARDSDKTNMSAGGLGAADSLCYLTCPEELAESGARAPDYQRFSWVPHHAKAEEFPLKRTESGLFASYIPPEEQESRAATKKQKEREADIERVKLVKTLLEEVEEKRLPGVQVARALQSRFRLSQSVAYRVIAMAKEFGVAKADMRDLVLVPVEEDKGGTA